MKRFFKAFLIITFFFITYHFCQKQTDGFTLQSILPRPLKNSKQWDIPPPSMDILNLLQQRFTYLGCGDQSFAFLGEDQKTVIKFFKHTHWLRKRNLEPQFESFKIAYEHLREETGLIYIHLNATENILPSVQIIDKLGIAHKIDLNKVEFALQERAELFTSFLDRAIQTGQIEEAKRAISSLMQCIHSRSKKGIGNRDNAFIRNYGYLKDHAILIDIGSLYKDELLSQREQSEEDLRRKTRRLGSWLKRHAPPELFLNYQEELEFSTL